MADIIGVMRGWPVDLLNASFYGATKHFFISLYDFISAIEHIASLEMVSLLKEVFGKQQILQVSITLITLLPLLM